MDRSQQAAEARLIAAAHAREASDFARAIVGSTSGADTAAERIRAGRRLRLLSLQVLQWTVRAEILRGTPWPELAAALGRDEESLRAEYEAGTLQWADRLADDAAAAEQSVEAARALDAWYRTHAEELIDPAEDAPVSGLFTPPNG
ncbi:hypothetical protein [Streptomyces tirandamycinicus]|uniref:Uncharacterized protein n=1 Tax=Streptomyces tirandamycinicus TaxID=2174846 RepID=A0A2S1T1X2_9ACTN|nr:hypothetical protein [Streptomyces tirandamycinicus]AWI32675.1 hypothetical protein DDW44_30635 [Streptomyces tirandamycinicus]